MKLQPTTMVKNVFNFLLCLIIYFRVQGVINTHLTDTTPDSRHQHPMVSTTEHNLDVIINPATKEKSSQRGNIRKVTGTCIK